MPLNKDKILRYRVLDECFRNTALYYDMNRLHQAVNKEVMRIYDKTVSKRSIQEDVKILQFSPYNVVFDEDLRKQGYYRYADPDFHLECVESLSKREQSAIRETIDLLHPIVGDVEEATPIQYYMNLCLQNIANGNKVSFDIPSVVFENNGQLAGMEHFATLAQHVMNRQPLIITYRPFNANKDLTFKIHPYLLKQYNGRWFLVAQAEGFDYFSTYPIDRVRKVELWKKAFQPPVTDINEYFRDNTGVTVTNKPVERIVLKISNTRYPYVETKPFSEMQKIVSHDAENHIITFPMRINREFEALLLSYGNDLEVLEPQCLRDSIAKIIRAMEQKYSAVQKDCTEMV